MASRGKIGALAPNRARPRLELDRLETTVRRDGDTWLLEGVKPWIANGTIADLVVAWARDTQDGQVKSFMVETPARGYEASVTTGKVSLQ